MGIKSQTKTEARGRRYLATSAERLRPERPPRGFRPREVSVTKHAYEGGSVFRLEPTATEPLCTLIYLHGGGYVRSIDRHHWQFAARLTKEVPLVCELPLYPLAPHGTAISTIEQLVHFVGERIGADADRPVFLGGDSAGGAMALVIAQQLRDRGTSGLGGLIAICPWLDPAMSNPRHEEIQPHDRIQSIPGLRELGRAFAGELDLDDPLLNPVNGGLQDLPPTLVFAGSHDMFSADIPRLEQEAAGAGSALDVRLGPGMQHIFPLLPIPEGDQARREAVTWIQNTVATK